MKPLVLMILDGWGIGEDSPTNAAFVAQTPNLDRYFAEYSHSQLKASGKDVGLPDGQMGNSEVGHLNIGSGRIIYQELTRISKSIDEGEFFHNQVLLDCMDKSKNHALHLMGLVSDGGVHSHIDHLLALVKMAQNCGLTRVYVHAFLDGRDVPPKSAVEYLSRLEEELRQIGVGRIATVSGRYYAMDRDKNWQRIKKAYDAMTCGQAEEKESALAGVRESYACGITDEFVVPFKVKGEQGNIEAGDGVIFFNFRPDRARQISRALNDREFSEFERCCKAMPVHFVMMTQYDVTIDAPVAFPPEQYGDIFGEVIARAGLKQLRIAETEKYAHVTFFFNGGSEIPNVNEERILIPSPKAATYDLVPAMSALTVTDTLLRELEKDKFDVVILNFANPDMVGHTGVLQAAISAMETVDTCVGKIVDKVLERNGVVCITADHGNLEQMRGTDGGPHTAHTTNPVPFILVDSGHRLVRDGILADIAPTVLELLGLDQPVAMTGHSLLLSD